MLQLPLLENLRREILPRLAVVLLVFLALFVVVSGIAMDTRPTAMRHKVSYTCQTASCTCAANPPNATFTPFCRGSVFERVIIPMIQHAISVDCFTDNGECLFTPQDLQTTVKLNCSASECVNTTAFPLSPLSVQESASSDADPSVDSPNSIVIALALTLLGLGMIIMYRHVAHKAQCAAVAEFRLLFLEKNTGITSDESQEGASAESARCQLVEERGLTVTAASTSSGVNSFEGDDADDNELLPSDRRPLMQGESSADESTRRARLVMKSRIELSLHQLSYALVPPPVFGRRGITPSDPLTILSNVSFAVHSGEMIALMGPSGAGKTTLLDILSARNKPGITTGTMKLGSDEISEANGNLKGYRSLVGYVPQEDTLLPALTVRQTVQYAAMLKLPCAFSHETISAVVDSLLESLGLVRCQHTLVGDSTRIRGVSGGERRRVSIAVELVANPRILFLDEPTSGLDACSALHVMQTVAKVARTSPLRRFAPHFFSFQPIVVFSIHQPSADIYRLFHKVLVLSRGVVVYNGIAEGAPAIMCARLCRLVASAAASESSRLAQAAALRVQQQQAERENPAELLMTLEEAITLDSVRTAMARPEDGGDDLLLRSISRELQQEASANHVDVDDADCTSHQACSSAIDCSVAMKKFYPDGWRQWQLLSQRSWTSLQGSYYLVVCHAFVTLLVGTLMNVLYHQEGLDLPGTLNRAGSVTFLLLVIAFVSLSALDQLLTERKLFNVERENGFYSTLPYFLAKVVVDILPLRIVPVVLLGGVIYGPMGLRTDGGSHWLWFLLILVLFSVCVTLAVMCIGVLTPTFGSSALLSSVVILWTFVFGGLLAQSDTMPAGLRPMRLLSPFFLAYESLIVNELDGLTCTFAPTDATGKPSADQIPLKCVQYVYNMGLNPEMFQRDVTLLAVQGAVLMWLCWFLLTNFSSVQR
jgi:ABC-type multidrug transport system ATPase subunit